MSISLAGQLFQIWGDRSTEDKSDGVAISHEQVASADRILAWDDIAQCRNPKAELRH